MLPLTDFIVAFWLGGIWVVLQSHQSKLYIWSEDLWQRYRRPLPLTNENCHVNCELPLWPCLLDRVCHSPFYCGQVESERRRFKCIGRKFFNLACKLQLSLALPLTMHIGYRSGINFFYNLVFKIVMYSLTCDFFFCFNSVCFLYFFFFNNIN